MDHSRKDNITQEEEESLRIQQLEPIQEEESDHKLEPIQEGKFNYSDIYQYISQKTYPSSFTKEEKRALRRRAKYFDHDEGQLTYIGSSGIC